jgi:hypothetical protein
MWATCYCICTVGYYKPTCSTRDFTNIIRASQLGGWIQCCNTHTIITSPRLVLWLFPHLHETPLLHERSSGTAMVKGGIGPVLTKVERACLWVWRLTIYSGHCQYMMMMMMLLYISGAQSAGSGNRLIPMCSLLTLYENMTLGPRVHRAATLLEGIGRLDGRRSVVYRTHRCTCAPHRPRKGPDRPLRSTAPPGPAPSESAPRS